MNKSKEIGLIVSLIPIVLLISMLTYNIFNYEWLGKYTFHIILLATALIVCVIGVFNEISSFKIFSKVFNSVKSISTPIIILLLVGALETTWKVSGVIPAMVYYGISFTNVYIFLPLTLIITAIVSLTAGSSYITSATVGIALVSVGNAYEIPPGITAVISGAYFGDKMSPLSDTTNLASAIAGTDLYTHIKYMMFTTFPTFIITIIIFCIITLSLISDKPPESAEVKIIEDVIEKDFYISPILFLIPGSVLILAYLKIKPVIALSFGVILAVTFSYIFQYSVLESIDPSIFKAIINSILTDTKIPLDIDTKSVSEELLNGIKDLYEGGGMKGMFKVITLTTCAMIFGGAMEAIGALKKITNELLKLANSVFGLVASTAISCFGINLFASDQYLAIIIPGKMFKKAYKQRSLSSENLSRTLEDSGTVTSPLIPWNTCGAYMSGVLNVSVGDYFIYAIFNWLSPIMTLLFALIGLKIRRVVNKKTAM